MLLTISLFSIVKMIETGQINRMWLRWSAGKPHRSCLRSDTVSLAIQNTASAFVMLMGGAAAAAALMAVEALCHWLKNRRIQDKFNPKK